MGKNILFRLAFLLVLAAVPAVTLHAAGETVKVIVLDIKQEIAPPVWLKAKKAWELAKAEGAGLILIHMNTYGGMLETADSLRTICLQSPVPVWVFIDNNAASAGALISIACERIYMRKGASIGAATVVNQTGEKLPDKYQSYMRSMMRSTAEARGRNPDIAEAMVDPTKRVEGISDSGKVVTLTSSEALKLGFCDGIAESTGEVLMLGGIKDYTVTELKLTSLEKMISFLIHPAVSGILILVIVAGIYFEFQSPGAVFPIVASIIAMALYFAPLYLEGLAEHWEILVFLAGVALLAVEIFAIPGFGVAGIAGIFLIIAGLTLALVGNLGFDFRPVNLDAFVRSFFLVVISMFAAVVLSIFGSRKLFTSKLFGGLALDTVQEAKEGYVSSDPAVGGLLGKTGRVYSILRPAGKIIIGDEVYDAVAESGYIDKGEAVEVVRYENAQLIVRRLQRSTESFPDNG